jgi:uncharacterized membrane protein YozB (DUF420 family)
MPKQEAKHVAVPTPLGSTLNLIFHLAILSFIITGFTFARRKKFNIHEKWMFSSIVLVAISFFLWMAPAYINNFKLIVSDFYAPGIIITNAHVFLGIVTGCLAVYIVLRMKLDLPERFTVKRVKRLMRTTFVLWLLTFLLGISFYVWYFVI